LVPEYVATTFPPLRKVMLLYESMEPQNRPK
jgi:hypothetical protein